MNNAHAIPADIIARRVISKGIDFAVPDKVLQSVVHSRDPLPMEPPRNHLQSAIVGTIFGRMRVMGCKPADGRDKAMYVCRCTCGAYEYRSAKAIRNPANQSDACYACRCIAQRRRNAHWKATGQERTAESFL